MNCSPGTTAHQSRISPVFLQVICAVFSEGKKKGSLGTFCFAPAGGFMAFQTHHLGRGLKKRVGQCGRFTVFTFECFQNSRNRDVLKDTLKSAATRTLVAKRARREEWRKTTQPWRGAQTRGHRARGTSGQLQRRQFCPRWRMSAADPANLAGSNVLLLSCSTHAWEMRASWSLAGTKHRVRRSLSVLPALLFDLTWCNSIDLPSVLRGCDEPQAGCTACLPKCPREGGKGTAEEEKDGKLKEWEVVDRRSQTCV